MATKATVRQVHPTAGGGGYGKATPSVLAQPPEKWTQNLSRAKADKICLACLEKIEQLVGSGMPLGDAVQSLSHRVTEPRLKGLAQSLWRGLSEGGSLSAAMRKQPKIFEGSMAAMIEAGEATGHLKPVLANVNKLLRERIQLRKELAQGLSYPIFILIMVGMVVLFVLYYLMPRVEGMMQSMGGELSLAARLIVGLSEAGLYAVPGAFALAIAIALGLQWWRRKEEGLLATDRLLLRIPVLRDIVLNAELGRLSNMAAILLNSGVDASDALRLLERGLRNAELRERFHRARASIKDGSSFTAALQRHELFRDMDLDVLSIAENTGNLGHGFESIHANRSEALRGQMQKLTAVVGSGALLLVFGIVSLVVLGVVSSILQLSNRVIGG